jgi:hypothetical protein
MTSDTAARTSRETSGFHMVSFVSTFPRSYPLHADVTWDRMLTQCVILADCHSEASCASQIQKPAGMTAFFGITTMPSRMK